jgi:hypothetical protein
MSKFMLQSEFVYLQYDNYFHLMTVQIITLSQ